MLGYIYQPEEEPEEGPHNIFGNTITGNSNVGIKIDFDGGCEIYDNTITDNEIEGIDIYSSFNNIIHDNKISGSQVLIYVDDNEDTCADNNIFYDNDLRDPVEGEDGPYYYVDDDACGDNYLSAYYDGETWLGCTEAYGEEGPYCHGNYYDRIDDCSLTNLYGDDIYYDSGDDYPIPSECIGEYFFLEGGDTMHPDYGPRTKGLTTTSSGGGNRDNGGKKESKPSLDMDIKMNSGNKTFEPSIDNKTGYIELCYGQPGANISLGIEGVEVLIKYQGRLIVGSCTTDSSGSCQAVLPYPNTKYTVKAIKEDYKDQTIWAVTKSDRCENTRQQSPPEEPPPEEQPSEQPPEQPQQPQQPKTPPTGGQGGNGGGAAGSWGHRWMMGW